VPLQESAVFTGRKYIEITGRAEQILSCIGTDSEKRNFMKHLETVQKIVELSAIAVATGPQEFSAYITS
jgi:hypothetical protein